MVYSDPGPSKAGATPRRRRDERATKVTAGQAAVKAEEKLDEELEESFPASDPPSNTPTSAGGPERSQTKPPKPDKSPRRG